MVKKQQMRWTPRGAHLLLQVRTRVLNDQLTDDFHRWYPGFTVLLRCRGEGQRVADADRGGAVGSHLFEEAGLARAAEEFGLSVTGVPVFGWRLRSIGAVAHGPSGACWLRVVSEQPQWATGEFWTGNQDANTLTGLPKPVVLASTEWDEAGWRSQRAEVMTLLPGEPCSPSDVLRTAIELPDSWYCELRRSLRWLANIHTTRITITQPRVNGLVRAAFGQHRNLTINHWETVHGDLHWGNLLQPQLGILDWEMWGKGPTGTDAATLYCYSLLNPDLSRRVHGEFADILDSPDGIIAQLWVAAHLLKRIRKSGDFPDLEAPLRNHSETLIS